jgi:hypothetical protein
VDAKLDKPAVERRQDWPLCMLDQVHQADADNVLAIASAAYKRWAEGQAAAGVQFEAALVGNKLELGRSHAPPRFTGRLPHPTLTACSGSVSCRGSAFARFGETL